MLKLTQFHSVPRLSRRISKKEFPSIEVLAKMCDNGQLDKPLKVRLQYPNHENEDGETEDTCGGAEGAGSRRTKGQEGEIRRKEVKDRVGEDRHLYLNYEDEMGSEEMLQHSRKERRHGGETTRKEEEKRAVGVDKTKLKRSHKKEKRLVHHIDKHEEVEGEDFLCDLEDTTKGAHGSLRGEEMGGGREVRKHREHHKNLEREAHIYENWPPFQR